MARALKATIDCLSLKNNLAKVRNIAKHSKVLAMIKANGYGHGIVNVAKALEDADAFGVACIEEAFELRNAGINNRIILMEGFFDVADELPEIIRLNLEPVIHHQEHIEALKHLPSLHPDIQDASLKVWLKINTGMHRLGFPIDKVKGAWQALKEMPWIHIEVLLSHFAKADEHNNHHTHLQMDRFFKIVQDLPAAKSLANSAAILAWESSHGDWVRPGVMLYGVSPFEGRHGAEEGLTPVMTLHSKIIAVQNLRKGDVIGYGGSFICQENMKIGIVAVGYGDGYPRLAPTGTPMLLNGKRVPLVGRVSMDMVSVDITSQPMAKIGDPIQLWGPDLPVEEVANAIGTTAYELLTGLSTRVPIEVNSV